MHNSSELWNLFSPVPMGTSIRCYFKQHFISLAFRNCEKASQLLNRSRRFAWSAFWVQCLRRNQMPLATLDKMSLSVTDLYAKALKINILTLDFKINLIWFLLVFSVSWQYCGLFKKSKMANQAGSCLEIMTLTTRFHRLMVLTYN